MSIHWLESTAEHGALLDLVPIVEHEPVLHRAADFLLPARDHLLLVCIDGLGSRDLSVA